MEKRFYKLVKAAVDCELFNEVKMLDKSDFMFIHLTVWKIATNDLFQM